MDFRKLINIIEGASGYIAKDSKEAKDPRFSTGLTKDVKPGEIDRQAAKFGNEFPPPLLHSKAAKNSTPNKLMNLGLNEAEDPKALQKDIITTVRKTTDPKLLQKVYDTLVGSGLEERLASVLSQDVDAKKYIKQIAGIIINAEGTLEEKNEFVSNYSRGFIDTKKLTDGNPHRLSDVVTDEFALKVFMELAALKEQGVGPGEIAFGVMSPQIQWVGQKGGGGDIIVDGKKVEVKGRLSNGGRWFDARKAKRDEHEIQRAFAKVGFDLTSELKIKGLNVDTWISLRTDPRIKDKVKDLAKSIADSNFKFVNTNKLVSALESGDRRAIDIAWLDVGFDNYKTYSGFDGMMLLDVGGGDALQYFPDFKSMLGKIRVSTIYMWGPSTDAMPQVTLNVKAAGFSTPPAPDAKMDARPVDVKPDAKPAVNRTKRQPVNISAAKPKLKAGNTGVGRTKRK